jgi:hypothetical protein
MAQITSPGTVRLTIPVEAIQTVQIPWDKDRPPYRDEVAEIMARNTGVVYEDLSDFEITEQGAITCFGSPDEGGAATVVEDRPATFGGQDSPAAAVGQKRPEKYVIWQNIDPDDSDRGWLAKEYPHLDEQELYQLIAEQNGQWLEDEKTNLAAVEQHTVLEIAGVGRWNGRFTGYRIDSAGFLYLHDDCDTGEFYGDPADREIKGTQFHHDSSHYIIYRGIKPSAAQEDIDDLLAFIYGNGNVPMEELFRQNKERFDKVTFSLYPEVAEIFGWA